MMVVVAHSLYIFYVFNIAFQIETGFPSYFIVSIPPSASLLHIIYKLRHLQAINKKVPVPATAAQKGAGNPF